MIAENRAVFVEIMTSPSTSGYYVHKEIKEGTHKLGTPTKPIELNTKTVGVGLVPTRISSSFYSIYLLSELFLVVYKQLNKPKHT